MIAISIVIDETQYVNSVRTELFYYTYTISYSYTTSSSLSSTPGCTLVAGEGGPLFLSCPPTASLPGEKGEREVPTEATRCQAWHLVSWLLVSLDSCGLGELT